jgi:maltose-binding protein MalE
VRSLNRCVFLSAIALALSACALVFFAGCGKKEVSGEIVIWEQKDPEEQVILNRRLAAFMREHPGITVSTSHFETDVLHSQFQTAALAGGGPDLVYGPSDKIGPYSVMQLIVPLEKHFDRSFFNEFEKAAVPMLGGHIYAVADQIGNHLMLIYNKALVNRAPEKSDEWIAMCREATLDLDGDGFPDQYGLVFNYREPFWLIPFLGGFGGWVVDGEYRPTLNTPAMVRALRFLADLRNKHRVVPKECSYELSDTMFKQGKAAFLINGPWSLKAYVNAGLDIGVAPIPVIAETGKHPVPMVSSKGYSISVNVPEEKLPIVRELLVYLTSEDAQREIVDELLILPSRSSLFRDEKLLENEILEGSMAQALLGRPMPEVPEMRAIWDAIRPFYQSVLGGQLEPDDAARKMQEQAVKKIVEMKQ